MSRHAGTTLRTLWLIAVLTCGVACTPSEKAPGAGTAATPNSVTVTASDFALEAPDTIDAGFTTIRLINRGSLPHMAHIVRVDSGKSVQELIEGYATAIRTNGPRPVWIKRFGGTAAEPNMEGNTTQLLEPGTYVWICPIEAGGGVPHFAKGMAKPFVVRARGSDAPHQTAPEASLVIRLIDYSFAMDTPLTAGRHVIRVENAGTISHDIALMKLASGKTMQDVLRAFEDGQAPPPAQLAGGIAPIEAGKEAFFEAELTSGEYVLVCFSTAPDGRPHMAHGMIQQIRIG